MTLLHKKSLDVGGVKQFRTPTDAPGNVDVSRHVWQPEVRGLRIGVRQNNELTTMNEKRGF